MSMFNDTVWDVKGNDELCVHNSKTIKEYAERFPRGRWFFLVHGSEKKWYGTYECKPDGSWNRTAEKMLQDPVIRYSVVPVPWRGHIRSKEEGKDNNSHQRQHAKH